MSFSQILKPQINESAIIHVVCRDPFKKRITSLCCFTQLEAAAR